MTTLQFLSTLRKKNIRIWADRDKVKYSGPAEELTPAVLAEILSRKAEILLLLGDMSLGGHSIMPASRETNLALSFAQRRLWFLDQFKPNSSEYNIPIGLHLQGRLDLSALEKSLDEIINRHEVLRTTFALVDDEPVQVIAPTSKIPLQLIELTDRLEAEREAEIQKILSAEATRPFDLQRDVLLRALLIRQGVENHILLLTMHHVISDGWSMGILYQELSTLYQSFANNQPSPLPPLTIQYADFAVWQRAHLQGPVLEQQLAYWKRQLSGSLPALELPTDHPRPLHQTFHGATHWWTIPSALSEQLDLLSRRQGVTLYMTLLAAFQTLLYRYSGQHDIVVGSPIANRNQTEIEGLVGFFVNTLVLRTDLSGDPSFSELLNRVREVALGAYAHQDIPFEKLVEELQPERELDRTPLFQVMFVLQNAPMDPLELTGLSITPMDIDTGTAKFDLTLQITQANGTLKGSLEYNTDLFEPATIQRMAEHYQTLLAGIVVKPEQRLSELPVLTERERHQLLVEWNDTTTAYPRDKCIHQLFEEQVARTPEAIAVVYENQQLTYRELNTRANQLAHYLQKQGVGPEVLVGICVERSLEMIVGLVGILKAGGAYVPLDPTYPQERLAFMMQDSRAQVLLTQERLRNRLPQHTAQVVNLDRDWTTIARSSQSNPLQSTMPDNLAYVTFTSGTTGLPKGTTIPHRGVVRLVQEANYCNLGAEETVLQFAPLAFDASTFEIWGRLLNGGRLAIFPAEMPSLGELSHALQKHRVTTLWLTAGLFHTMVDERLQDLGDLHQMLAGGDVLSVSHVLKFIQAHPQCQLINGYGPTEATTFTSCYPVLRDKQIDITVPIGRPISNTQIYILDAHLQPVPINVPGELYIGGPGLARGYLNRPELTAEKFIPNPFGSDPSLGTQEGTRLYRTGDRVRYLPDGNIEFLGRIDQQVKIRGFRVELREIENVLGEHSSVRECAVVALPEVTGDKHLVAYVVPQVPQEADANTLSQFLQQKIPHYMIPSTFVFIESLPLTPEGKVNRHVLPAPERSLTFVNQNHLIPKDYIELQLVQIWEKVLNVHPVGVSENFFHLGGHSLMAIRLFNEIEKVFGKELPISILFEAPTVKQLATILGKEGWRPNWSSILPIQPQGSKPPLFCIPPLNAAISFYHLSYYLGLDQPVYALVATPKGDQNFFTCIEDEATYYVREMRAFQPHGPYFLAGWSYGGMVALEVAQQLRTLGENVALLAMLDAGFEPTDMGSEIRRLQRRWRYIFSLGPQAQMAGLKKNTRAAITKVSEFLESQLRNMHSPTSLSTSENGSIPDLDRVSRYNPRPYLGRVTLFRTDSYNAPLFRDPLIGWDRLAHGGLEVYDVPGTHTTLLLEPNVKELAEKLKACLLKAQAENERAN